MKYTDEYLDEAHAHCKAHREDVVEGPCGCFYCLKTFEGSRVREWIRRAKATEKNTAVCPYCGVDTVLPAARGLPVEDPEFLSAMRRKWIETTHTLEEVRNALDRPGSAPPS